LPPKSELAAKPSDKTAMMITKPKLGNPLTIPRLVFEAKSDEPGKSG
jgi:hypothetical protein